MKLELDTSKPKSNGKWVISAILIVFASGYFWMKGQTGKLKKLRVELAQSQFQQFKPFSDSIELLENSNIITLKDIQDRKAELDVLELELTKKDTTTLSLEEALNIIKGN